MEPYQPTLESISTHTVPDWYQDAKLGIFVHYGLFSVPGWAVVSEGGSCRRLRKWVGPVIYVSTHTPSGTSTP